MQSNWEYWKKGPSSGKNLEKILTLHYAMVLLRAGRKEGDLMLTDGGGEMLYMVLICYVMMMYC